MEKANLDAQIAAIKAMEGPVAFADACKSHLTWKITIDDKLNIARKEVQKHKRTLNSMLKTQHAISIELARSNKVRKAITASDMFKPKHDATTSASSMHAVADLNNNIIENVSYINIAISTMSAYEPVSYTHLTLPTICSV